MRIRVLVQTNHFFLFWQQKYTKDGCEGKNIRTEEKPCFVYLCIVYWCIGAKKSQPYGRMKPTVGEGRKPEVFMNPRVF